MRPKYTLHLNHERSVELIQHSLWWNHTEQLKINHFLYVMWCHRVSLLCIYIYILLIKSLPTYQHLQLKYRYTKYEMNRYTITNIQFDVDYIKFRQRVDCSGIEHDC